MILKSTYFFKALVLGAVVSSTACMDPATELNYQATIAGYQRGKTQNATADIKRRSLVPRQAISSSNSQFEAGVIVNDPFAYGNAAFNPIAAQPVFNSDGSSPYGSLAAGQGVITPNVFAPNGGQNIYQQPAYGNSNIYSPYNPIRR